MKKLALYFLLFNTATYIFSKAPVFTKKAAEILKNEIKLGAFLSFSIYDFFKTSTFIRSLDGETITPKLIHEKLSFAIISFNLLKKSYYDHVRCTTLEPILPSCFKSTPCIDNKVLYKIILDCCKKAKK